MSTMFVADQKISFDSLRNLDADDVRTQEIDENGNILLTDGKSCLWVYQATTDWPVAFERCGKNDPAMIISAIEKVLNVCLISEYEEEFEKLRKMGSAGTDRLTVV